MKKVKKIVIFISKKFVILKLLFTFATVIDKINSNHNKRRINRTFDKGKERRKFV